MNLNKEERILVQKAQKVASGLIGCLLTTNHRYELEESIGAYFNNDKYSLQNLPFLVSHPWSNLLSGRSRQD